MATDYPQVNDQMIVVYEDVTGTRIYTTAYDAEESRLAVGRCLARYGRGARVRTITSPDFPLG